MTSSFLNVREHICVAGIEGRAKGRIRGIVGLEVVDLTLCCLRKVVGKEIIVCLRERRDIETWEGEDCPWSIVSALFDAGRRIVIGKKRNISPSSLQSPDINGTFEYSPCIISCWGFAETTCSSIRGKNERYIDSSRNIPCQRNSLLLEYKRLNYIHEAIPGAKEIADLRSLKLSPRRHSRESTASLQPAADLTVS